MKKRNRELIANLRRQLAEIANLQQSYARAIAALDIISRRDGDLKIHIVELEKQLEELKRQNVELRAMPGLWQIGGGFGATICPACGGVITSNSWHICSGVSK